MRLKAVQKSLNEDLLRVSGLFSLFCLLYAYNSTQWCRKLISYTVTLLKSLKQLYRFSYYTEIEEHDVFFGVTSFNCIRVASIALVWIRLHIPWISIHIISFSGATLRHSLL